MESDEEDQNEEIGVQGGDQEEKEKKKNWKKSLEEKKAQEEERKKKLPPPQPRTKTDRGDYVVTGFNIPDRVSQIEKKVLAT